MTEKKQRVSAYVDQRTKNELQHRAEEAGVSESEYVRRIVRSRLAEEAKGEIASEVRALEQLQEVIDRGTRQLRDASSDIRDMNAKMGVYAIANFELLKQEHSGTMQKDALRTAARRLRQDDHDHGLDDDDESEPEDTSGGIDDVSVPWEVTDE